jgi:hypothetical protein
VAGAYAHVFTHSAAVANGSEPGELMNAYRVYAKAVPATASARPIRHSSGPIG